MPEIKPTASSPETQQIVDMALALAAGDRGQAEELQTRLALRTEEMAQAMDRFFGDVEQQGPEFGEQYRAELDEIEAGFRAYEAALGHLSGGLASPERLREGAEALAEASNQLNFATARYEERYMTRGDSKFPLVNLFDNLGRSLREGQAPLDLWQSTCQWYIEFYRRAIAEIDASDDKEAPGVPERRKSMSWSVEILETMQALDAGHAQDSLAARLGELTTAHLDMEKAFDRYHQHVFGEGPSAAPAVNMALKAVQGFRDGTYQAETLTLALEAYQARVRESIAQLQPALDTPEMSAVLSEEMAAMLEGLEGMEDALDVLLRLPQEPGMDPEELESALDLLQSSGDRVASATRAVNEYTESVGKVTCLHCQAQNPPGARTCSGCQRALPQLEAAPTTSFQVLEGGRRGGPDFTQDQVMTTVMQELFEKCDAFLRGEIEPLAFRQDLDQREAQIDQADEKLMALAPPDVPQGLEEEDRVIAHQFVDLTEDVLDLLHMGLEECRHGLDKMRMAADDRDEELIEEGKKLYYDGSQKLWQVWRVDDSMQRYLAGEEVAVSDAPRG